jgi:hypothetical protein
LIHEKQAKIVITCAKFVFVTFVGAPVFEMGCAWSCISVFFLAGCERDSMDQEDARLHHLLALSVHNELFMYEKGFAAGIMDTPTFFMIESSLQENLLRAIYVVSSIETGKQSGEGRYQLEAELNRAKAVLNAHPIRTIWPLREVEREFGEFEAILPKKILAREGFESYFGTAAIREVQQGK